MSKFIISTKDIVNCMLCHDAPCTKGCYRGVDCASLIRSLRFSNYEGVLSKVTDACLTCNASCENNCILDNPIKIKKILSGCFKGRQKFSIQTNKADISTTIFGFKLENPFLLSASVVSSKYEMLKRAFKAGWAGATLKTISYMKVNEASPRYSALRNIDGSFAAFKNIELSSDHRLEETFETVKKLKTEFPNKFISVSIMGRNEEEWKKLAFSAEQSGADAIELNFSCPHFIEDLMASDIGENPELVEKYTKAVKSVVKIPVLAKLTPNVLTMTPSADAAIRGGADGISAINTIKSLTDLNVLNAINNNLKGAKISIGGLSGQSVKPVALRFISELVANPNLKDKHISAMGGICTWEDAITFIALGAGTVQVTTAVMEFGYRIINDLIEGLQLFIGNREYKSLDEFKGTLSNSIGEVAKVNREYILLPKFNRTTCVSCGRCYISCMDGGNQAIKFMDRFPILDPSKCVGCHLCVLVCPNNSVTVDTRTAIKKKDV